MLNEYDDGYATYRRLHYADVSVKVLTLRCEHIVYMLYATLLKIVVARNKCRLDIIVFSSQRRASHHLVDSFRFICRSSYRKEFEAYATCTQSNAQKREKLS